MATYDYRYWGGPNSRHKIPFYQALNNMSVNEFRDLLYNQNFTEAADLAAWQAHAAEVLSVEQPLVVSVLKPKGFLSAMLIRDELELDISDDTVWPVVTNRPNRMLTEQGFKAIYAILEDLKTLYTSTPDLFLTSTTIANIREQDNWYLETPVTDVHYMPLFADNQIVDTTQYMTNAQPNERLIDSLSAGSWELKNWENDGNPDYGYQIRMADPAAISAVFPTGSFVGQHDDFHGFNQIQMYQGLARMMHRLHLRKAPTVVTSGTTDTTWTGIVTAPNGTLVKDTDGDFSAVQVGDVIAFSNTESGRITSVNNTTKELYVQNRSISSTDPRNKAYTIVRGMGYFKLYWRALSTAIDGSAHAMNLLDDPDTSPADEGYTPQLRLTVQAAMDAITASLGMDPEEEPLAAVFHKSDNSFVLTNATASTTSVIRDLDILYNDPARMGDVWAGYSTPAYVYGNVSFENPIRVMLVADDFTANLATGTTSGSGNTGTTVALSSLPGGLAAGDYFVNEDDDIFSTIVDFYNVSTSTAGSVTYTTGATSAGAVSDTTTSNNTRLQMRSDAGAVLDGYLSITVPSGNVPRKVWIEGHANEGTSGDLYADVYVWNFNTTAWVQLNASTSRIAHANGTDSNYAYDIGGADFVSGDEVRIRFVLSETGTSKLMRIDYLYVESVDAANVLRLEHDDTSGNSKAYTIYQHDGLFIRSRATLVSSVTLTDYSKNFTTLGVQVGDIVSRPDLPRTGTHTITAVGTHTITMYSTAGERPVTAGEYIIRSAGVANLLDSSEGQRQDTMINYWNADREPYRDSVGRSQEFGFMDQWYAWLGDYLLPWCEDLYDEMQTDYGTDGQLKWMILDQEAPRDITDLTVLRAGNFFGTQSSGGLDNTPSYKLTTQGYLLTDEWTDRLQGFFGPDIEAALQTGTRPNMSGLGGSAYALDIVESNFSDRGVHCGKMLVAEAMLEGVTAPFVATWPNIRIMNWWDKCQTMDLNDDDSYGLSIGYISGTVQSKSFPTNGYAWHREYDRTRDEYPRGEDERSTDPIVDNIVRNAIRTTTGGFPLVTLETYPLSAIINTGTGVYVDVQKGSTHLFNGVYIDCPVQCIASSELGSWATEFGPRSGSITGATNATPIVITSTGHGLRTGARVGISSVNGNLAANTETTIIRLDDNTFSLDGTVGSGAYTSGGTWTSKNINRVSAIGHMSGGSFVSGVDGDGNITAIQYEDLDRYGAGSTSLSDMPVDDLRSGSIVNFREPWHSLQFNFRGIRGMFAAVDYPTGGYHNMAAFAMNPFWPGEMLIHATMHGEIMPSFYNSSGDPRGARAFNEQRYNQALKELDTLIPVNRKLCSLNYETEHTCNLWTTDCLISAVTLPTRERLFRVTLLPARSRDVIDPEDVGPTEQFNRYVQFTTRSGDIVLIPGKLVGSEAFTDNSTTPNPRPGFESDFADSGYWVIAKFPIPPRKYGIRHKGLL